MATNPALVARTTLVAEEPWKAVWRRRMQAVAAALDRLLPPQPLSQELVPAFLEAYPKLSLEISLTDQVIDLLEQRTDVALRSGPLKSSQLIARKLGAARMIIVGSPAYFARYGVPRKPGDLARHNRLGFNYARMAKGWPLIDGGVEKTIPPSGNLQVSDGDALRALAINGVGLVRLASFIVKDDIAANRLVPVLEEFNPGDIDELHAVYLGQGGLLPIRIRVLLEFLAERIKIGDPWPTKDA